MFRVKDLVIYISMGRTNGFQPSPFFQPRGSAFSDANPGCVVCNVALKTNEMTNLWIKNHQDFRFSGFMVIRLSVVTSV